MKVALSSTSQFPTIQNATIVDLHFDILSLSYTFAQTYGMNPVRVGGTQISNIAPLPRFRRPVSPTLDTGLLYSPYLLGLRGLLNPPTRFMYCRYSVFFSFLTAYTLFPGTFVFCVVLNVAKPIVFRNRAVSGSESTSMAAV